jgi:hypothetical protein
VLHNPCVIVRATIVVTERTMPNTQYPAWATIAEWQRLSGDGRSKTYEKLADGRLRGVKDGKRLKIDVEHGLTQIRNLPPAKIGLRKPAA